MYTPVNQMYPHAEQGRALGLRDHRVAGDDKPHPESQMSIALNEAEAAAGALLSMIDSIGTTLRDALAPVAPEVGAEGAGQNTQCAPSEMRGRIENVTATINAGIDRLRNLRDRIEI